MEHGGAFSDAWLAVSVLSVQATWSGDVLAITDALENAGVVAGPVKVFVCAWFRTRVCVFCMCVMITELHDG